MNFGLRRISTMYNLFKSLIWMIVLIVTLVPSTVTSYNLDLSQIVEKPSLVSYTKYDLQIYKTVGNSQDVKLVTDAASVIKLHEGFSSKPYKDSSGHWTQGYGRLLKSKKPFSPVTEKQAYLWMLEDVTEIVSFFDQNIPWWRSLNSTRQQVLINLGYNLGPNGLMKFTSFLECMKSRQYTRASNMLLYTKNTKSRYWSQVGDRALHLSKAVKTGKWDMEEIQTLYG